MRPATTYPARRDDVRLLVVDPVAGSYHAARSGELPSLLRAHDLLVVNDAATLPASLTGHDEGGRPVEARLAGWGPPEQPLTFWAVLFGAGDWRWRTEDRPAPAPQPVGARLHFGALTAEVVERSPLSPRLVALRFQGDADQLWAGMYRYGRPVQYAHLAHPLPLWAVQTVYAARPWAFEMPSAGRPLSWEILQGLRRAGVELAAITHAAGLSATGDPAIDAALPLPERYQVPAATVEAIGEARRHGGRVLAVGTSVVRALESAAYADRLVAGGGVTSLRIGPQTRLQVVDGILTGIHVEGESHFALLGALAPAALLAETTTYASAHGFTTHELGDLMLLLPPLAATRQLSPNHVNLRRRPSSPDERTSAHAPKIPQGHARRDRERDSSGPGLQCPGALRGVDGGGGGAQPW